MDRLTSFFYTIFTYYTVIRTLSSLAAVTFVLGIVLVCVLLLSSLSRLVLVCTDE
jgi:hypothetical protein